MRLGVALTLIVCFVAADSEVTTKLQQELRAREDVCIGDHDVLYVLDRIDLLRHTRKLPEDGLLDEFATCLLKTYHICNADGTINADVNKHWLISDDEHKTTHSKDCISKSKIGADNKDNIRKIFECYLLSDISIIDFTPRTRTMKPRSLF